MDTHHRACLLVLKHLLACPVLLSGGKLCIRLLQSFTICKNQQLFYFWMPRSSCKYKGRCTATDLALKNISCIIKKCPLLEAAESSQVDLCRSRYYCCIVLFAYLSSTLLHKVKIHYWNKGNGTSSTHWSEKPNFLFAVGYRNNKNTGPNLSFLWENPWQKAFRQEHTQRFLLQPFFSAFFFLF